MADIKALQKNIKRRNLLATSLIAILVSISFLSLIYLLKQQEQDARIINMAGSQRMLSQKISLIAHHHYQNILNEDVGVSHNNNLVESARLFESNQKLLLELAEGKSSSFPEEVKSLYLNSPTYLNNSVKLYVKSALELSQTIDKYVAKNLIEKQFNRALVENLLTSLDLAVTKIEEHANQRIAYIKVFEMSIWLAIIVLLVAISFFIFSPLQRLISQNYQELYQAKQESAEFNFAINKHAIVFRISMEKKGIITKVNQRFLDFYRYTEEDIIGESVFSICSDKYSQENYETIFKGCVDNEFWHGESINKIKGGRELWLNTTIVPLVNNKDRIASFIIIQNDISGIKQTELALNKLHQITSDLDKTLDDKIQDILYLGKQIFDLPLALISEINEQKYQVLYSHTPNGEINPGDTFELGNTYCFHTLLADKPLAFHEAGKSEIKDHPCYQGFGLESYIGAPVVVNGKRFGTINFSGPEPSYKPFSDRELELIQLFSYWISAELTRANQQNKLLWQQGLMEEMGQQARIGAWEVDLENNTIYWSNITKEIHEVPYDYQPDLTTAINFYKEGESRDTVQTLVERSISDGISYEEDLQLVTAKGNDIWVSARSRSEFKNGKCVRLFGSFQDINDKKFSEQKLAEHSQRMSLATDSAGIGIWELNLITEELKWDDWMFKLYGVLPEHFSGAYEAWEKGLHPDDLERAGTELRQAVENRGKFITQFRIVWPNGEIKHLKAAAILSFDEDHNPISMIGVNYDVTELVENEIALIKAKEQAEIAVTAKNEFFASMSHEIRTPMNGVIGMLDLVRESELEPEQKHRISIAQKSAKSLLSLINDILDFSKIDANKLELENVSFNLRKMVGDLAEAFSQQAEHKNLELIVDLVEVEESLVNGDSNRIRQILTNLVGNAIKFTKEGEVVIRLSQQDYSKSHWKVTISVSDTGIGISKDKKAGLFEAFSQVDASTTREYGGTGLGLAIVKKLCLCMQGTVRVEDNDKLGSIFTCELLLDKSKESLLSTPAKELEGKRILIVDHNHSCAEVIKRQLISWNLDAHIIGSGQKALSSITDHAAKPEYDLIIIDQQIPDIESAHFVKTIRSYPSLESLKILFMTRMSSQNDLGDSEQIGFDGYFPKPVTTFDLHRALNSLIDSPKEKIINSVVKQEAIEDITTDSSWFKNVKLLLVEDNRVNQMVAMGVLKKIGIENCVIAVNGKDALNKLKLSDEQAPFTFIFMDCQMPEMDGYEATMLIRQGDSGERYKSIPIVAMTANAMLGDEQKCLTAGMDDYLAKPINKELVLQRLHKFLRD